MSGAKASEGDSAAGDHLLSLEEALALAQPVLDRESEVEGVEVVVGPGTRETPGFWVLLPNARTFVEGGRSADSLSSRLPPIVIDRRTGDVRRPFAAGGPIVASTLGRHEWFVPQLTPAVPEARIPDARLFRTWSRRELRSMASRLAHFRILLAGRDSGDELVATLIADAPLLDRPVLADAGLAPADGGAAHTLRGVGRMIVSTRPDSAEVSIRISGNHPGSAWTFGEEDLRLAESVEEALAGAAWIRAWIEPSGALTPQTYPELFAR